MIFAENAPEIGRGSILVVCGRLYNDRDAIRPVAFIDKLLYDAACNLACSFLNGPFNRVVWHVLAPSSKHGGPQSSVKNRISAAHSGSYHDFLGEPTEQLTSLGV